MKVGDKIVILEDYPFGTDYTRGDIATVVRYEINNDSWELDSGLHFMSEDVNKYYIVCTNLSREEIEALLNENLARDGKAAVSKYYDPFTHKTVVAPTSPVGHTHSWGIYTGLVEQFEHCTGCGERKK